MHLKKQTKKKIRLPSVKKEKKNFQELKKKEEKKNC